MRYILSNYLQSAKHTYKGFALCYLYFAKEHKELFKFLYLRKREVKETLDDINYDQAIALLAEALQLPLSTTKELHQRMQMYCYSLGVMIATNYQEYSYEQIDAELSNIFRIMLLYYKNITNEADFNYWLNKTHHLHYQ